MKPTRIAYEKQSAFALCALAQDSIAFMRLALFKTKTGKHMETISSDPEKPSPQDVLSALSNKLEFEDKLLESCDAGNSLPCTPVNTDRMISQSVKYSSDGRDVTDSSKHVHSSDKMEPVLAQCQYTAEDPEALRLLNWLASSQAAEDINSDDELRRETILSPLMPATTINEVLEKADMEFLSSSQQECQDILDSVESVQDSTDVECKTKREKPIHHTRKTFKLEKNKGKRPIWGSLPFCSTENANDGRSMGVKAGRCDGESTIVGCSIRDLMRRKRLHRREPPKVKIHHDVEVTPDKESNKRITSSPKKKVFNTKFSLPSFLKQVKKLTNSQKDSIKRAGFGNLLRIPDHVLRRSQLIQLMEKWSCEKQAFIFPPGELKITPLDVSLILGLQVIGQPVVLKEGAPLTTLETEFGASVSNRAIGVELLKERLESVGERDDESFIRVFLLYCFGTLLFPSANGKVDSRYLYLLQDVDSVSSFAWGAAVLEDLHNCLSQRISKKTSNIGGCLILLQIWCYEHIIIGRPKLLDYPFRFPRACRWESSARHYLMSSQFNINFEELEHTQILWKLEPTSDEIELDIIREIPQEWYLRTGPGTIEEPIEVQSERAIRMVGVRRKEVEEEPMRQEKSTILVISDDEESKVENEELMKRVQDEVERRKRVEMENEELMKRVQDEVERRKQVEVENEELTKRVEYEVERRKKVEVENEKLCDENVLMDRCISDLGRLLVNDSVDL